MAVMIGRHINGITINNLEFMLGSDKKPMTFDSAEQTNAHLIDLGFEQAEIDLTITFKEVE